MKVLVDGKLYDSSKTPMLLIFDNEWEKKTFGMNRFVSAPDDSTVEERQTLIDTEIIKGTIIEHLEHYSEDTMTQFIEQAIGKPVNNRNGIQVGETLGANRIGNTKYVRLEVIMWGKL